jgi:hypothetical protein
MVRLAESRVAIALPTAVKVIQVKHLVGQISALHAAALTQIASPMRTCLIAPSATLHLHDAKPRVGVSAYDQDQARWPHGECTKFGYDGCGHGKAALNLHRHVSWTVAETRSQLVHISGRISRHCLLYPATRYACPIAPATSEYSPLPLVASSAGVRSASLTSIAVGERKIGRASSIICAFPN